MTKHTPGPWKLNEVYDIIICDSSGSYRIANICSNNMGVTTRNQADARLITAAPDMLDALESAQTALYDAMHAGNLSREYAGGAIKKIEAALTKAMGGK